MDIQRANVVTNIDDAKAEIAKLKLCKNLIYLRKNRGIKFEILYLLLEILYQIYAKLTIVKT